MLECLHNVPVWRQLRAVGSHVVYRSLDLVEYEHRWPSMMMDGLFVTRLQGDLKHSEPLILKDDLVVLRSSHNGIKCRIPIAIINHVTPGSKRTSENRIIQFVNEGRGCRRWLGDMAS